MPKQNLNQPAVRKGARFPVEVCAAAWIDLLGYGQQVSDAEFNPMNPKTKAAIDRLRRFHRITSERSSRRFPSLVMNDGAVTYSDLTFRGEGRTRLFLHHCFSLFEDIQKVEHRSADPGPRMVIAAGFRYRGRRAGIDASEGHITSLLQRLASGKITIEQALRETKNTRPSFDIVPQLQANFAFTKAYLAEQSGSRGGLAGSNCFVDLAFFRNGGASAKLGHVIEWKHSRLSLSAQFAPMLELVSAPEMITGVCDTLTIGERLANDPKLLEFLHSYRKDSAV